MRYTLRLLTTQQFERAAAVIAACETIRRERVGDPGGPCSPGTVGREQRDPNLLDDARLALAQEGGGPTPAQLVRCPACGEDLDWMPEERQISIQPRCPNTGCTLGGVGDRLPIYTVDDDLFAHKPTLVIATIDKIAQIVRWEAISDFFSISPRGDTLLSPPDLIIQDELHLISGPLGTVAGLYEMAIDRLFTRDGHRPKIIGSTATIRRADEQVRALFDRSTCQFPPPGINAGDSGFAVIDIDKPDQKYTATPGRCYAGVTTAGRSAKFILQAVAASLLQSASLIEDPVARDNYWTLVTYFNSLRELGGAVVLMHDDVRDSITNTARLFGEPARNVENVKELTSRRTQEEIRDMLVEMRLGADSVAALDAVLATNMVSVGVDIARLGIMLVHGQPKSTSEYIQATSRVGRGEVPGLIVSVLNNAKARDRSHYETFGTWHDTFTVTWRPPGHPVRLPCT